LLVEISFGSYLGPSALNGNIKVQAHFLKAKQGYDVRKVEKDKWIYYIFISTGHEIQEQKEVPVCYAVIYRPNSSTARPI
jgi:hypothetical protein